MAEVEALPAPDYLRALASALSTSYQDAQPFPHVVMDEFLPEPTAQAVLDEFPGPEGIEWGSSYADGQQLKLACEDETQMGAATRRLIAYLNSGVFLRFLEGLTGIDGLVPDPYLKGGGLHQIRPGGFLKVHADFNWYARLKLDRRLNLLLYLNREWQEEYGGHLELWDGEMSQCQRRISPEFNRCVVFSTTDRSFHGHPDLLRCPPGRTRKSLALYYYTNGRPETERSAPHTTLFKDRPDDGRALARDVSAQLRREKQRRIVRSLIPPVCWDTLALLKRLARERLGSR